MRFTFRYAVLTRKAALHQASGPKDGTFSPPLDNQKLAIAAHEGPCHCFAKFSPGFRIERIDVEDWAR
jgi:hypothetical protein